MSDSKTYFTHINGLRGVAIIMVILFHLEPNTFPCCFYGVDVFLVITGYLLFLGLKRVNGTLLGAGNFALKRAARILPPVAVLVMLTLVAVFFFLDFQDAVAVSRLGRYTLFGMANVHLKKISADYFATDFSENPLMHMWYIGVILQVYLMFVVGNVICKRIPRRIWLPVLFVLGGASLALCCRQPLIVWLRECGFEIGLKSENPGYFETLPRVWEVLAGGLVCLLPEEVSRWKATVLTLLGLAAVLLPSFLLRDNSSLLFPIVVVAGTVLIIKYMPSGTLSATMNNRVLMAVGTISFSLYLIHLPIFVCYKSWHYGVSEVSDYVVMLLLTAGIGGLFYWLVEIRKWSWKVWAPIWGAGIAVCVLTKSCDGFGSVLHSEKEMSLLPSYNDWSTEENPDMMRGFDTSVLKLEKGVFTITENKRKLEGNLYLLKLGDSWNSPNFVLLGDSHAQAAYPGLDVFCRRNNRAGVYVASIISPFWNMEIVPLSRGSSYFCNKRKMEALMYWLSQHPELKYVIISQYWVGRQRNNYYDWSGKPTDCSDEAHKKNLQEFLLRLKSMGKTAVVFAPSPNFNVVPPRRVRLIKRRGHMNEKNATTPLNLSFEQYMSRHGGFIEILRSLEKEGLCSVIDPSVVLGEDRVFHAYNGDKVLFRDGNHYSVPGSILYMQKMAPQIKEIIPQVSAHTNTK